MWSLLPLTIISLLIHILMAGRYVPHVCTCVCGGVMYTVPTCVCLSWYACLYVRNAIEAHCTYMLMSLPQ